jgi:hypothetical protein
MVEISVHFFENTNTSSNLSTIQLKISQNRISWDKKYSGLQNCVSNQISRAMQIKSEIK